MSGMCHACAVSEQLTPEVTLYTCKTVHQVRGSVTHEPGTCPKQVNNLGSTVPNTLSMASVRHRLNKV